MKQKMKICEYCYREVPGEEMASDIICNTCKAIIGKGDGYGAEYSDEEANKWYEGIEDRKKKLEEEGKI